MKQKIYVPLFGSIIILVLLISNIVWLKGRYHSAVSDYRQTMNQSLARACDVELRIRTLSLGKEFVTWYTPLTDTSEFVTKKIQTPDTVFTVRIRKDDPTAMSKIWQYAFKDFLPPNVTCIDSLFKRSMFEKSIPVEESYAEYLDLKKNITLDGNGPEVKPSGYLVSDIDTLDILKTVGVRVWAKAPASAMIQSVMPQLIISTALIVAASICLFLLLRTVYRQRRGHEKTIELMADQMEEIGRVVSEDAEQTDRLMIHLRRMHLEEEAGALDRSKFHSFRLTLFGLKILEIVRNQNKPLYAQKTPVSLRTIFREMQVKYENRDNALEPVTIIIPEEDIVIRTDEKHLCNVIDILFDIATAYCFAKEVHVDANVVQDEHNTKIIIRDDAGFLSESDYTLAFTETYDINRCADPGFEIKLRYVRSVVTALGGSFGVRGQKNRFTEFKVILSLTSAESETTSSPN